MPRIRTIKPDFFTSADIIALSLPARLLYIAIWCEADREGRLAWQPETLLYRYLPGDANYDIEAITNELVDRRLVIVYQANHKTYAYVPSFKLHQVINNREPESRISPPPTDLHHETQKDEVLPASSIVIADECNNTGQDHKSNIHPDCNTDRCSENCEDIIARGEDTVTYDGDTVTCDEDVVSRNGDAVSRGEKNQSCLAEGKGKEGKGKEGKGKEGKGKEVVALKTRRLSCSFPPVQKNSLSMRVLEDRSGVVGEHAEQVAYIFTHWQQVMDHPRSQLSSDRQVLILQALKWGYSVVDLCSAINGCAKTPHNLGENPQCQRYDGLSVIFKNCDQIERFIRNCNHPPQNLSKDDQRMLENFKVARDWCEQSNHCGENNEAQ